MLLRQNLKQDSPAERGSDHYVYVVSWGGNYCQKTKILACCCFSLKGKPTTLHNINPQQTILQCSPSPVCKMLGSLHQL